MRGNITGLHHAQITIPKGAEPAARRFYMDVLCLREVPKPLSLQGRGGFWLQAGDDPTLVHVGVEDGVDRAATKAHLAYQVGDAAAWRDHLAAHGVPMLDAVPIPGFERFEFRDPFGNRVEIIQPLGARTTTLGKLGTTTCPADGGSGKAP